MVDTNSSGGITNDPSRLKPDQPVLPSSVDTGAPGTVSPGTVSTPGAVYPTGQATADQSGVSGTTLTPPSPPVPVLPPPDASTTSKSLSPTDQQTAVTMVQLFPIFQSMLSIAIQSGTGPFSPLTADQRNSLSSAVTSTTINQLNQVQITPTQTDSTTQTSQASPVTSKPSSVSKVNQFLQSSDMVAVMKSYMEQAQVMINTSNQQFENAMLLRQQQLTNLQNLVKSYQQEGALKAAQLNAVGTAQLTSAIVSFAVILYGGYSASKAGSQAAAQSAMHTSQGVSQLVSSAGQATTSFLEARYAPLISEQQAGQAFYSNMLQLAQTASNTAKDSAQQYQQTVQKLWEGFEQFHRSRYQPRG